MEAAARLVKAGLSPTLVEVAEEALLSRATAYRHFPNIQALMAETALHVAHRPRDQLSAAAPGSPVEDNTLAPPTFGEFLEENEVALRYMLIKSLKVSPASPRDRRDKRHARRAPLIERAVAPVRRRLTDPVADRLTAILALIIATEARLVATDTLRLDRKTASEAKAWAIRVLVSAALRESAEHGTTEADIEGEGVEDLEAGQQCPRE